MFSRPPRTDSHLCQKGGWIFQPKADSALACDCGHATRHVSSGHGGADGCENAASSRSPSHTHRNWSRHPDGSGGGLGPRSPLSQPRAFAGISGILAFPPTGSRAKCLADPTRTQKGAQPHWAACLGQIPGTFPMHRTLHTARTVFPVGVWFPARPPPPAWHTLLTQPTECFSPSAPSGPGDQGPTPAGLTPVSPPLSPAPGGVSFSYRADVILALKAGFS